MTQVFNLYCDASCDLEHVHRGLTFIFRIPSVHEQPLQMQRGRQAAYATKTGIVLSYA